MWLRLTVSRRELRFWGLQLGVWTGYAALLMAPWIGQYSIASMLPNKVTIAATGLLASGALRMMYRTSLERHVAGSHLMLLSSVASVAAGIAWGAALAVLLGGTPATSWRISGTLDGGIPQLGGAPYHALVLLVWSQAYLVIRRRRRVPAPQPIRTIGADARASRIAVRDGSRTIILENGELAWAKADGDYVRLHTDRRSFLIRATMTQLEASLPASEYVRIHRSAIVNLASVRELEARPNSELAVVLRDGTKVKASRRYADRLRVVLSIRAKGR